MKKKQIDNIYIKIDLGMFACSANLAPKFSLFTLSNLLQKANSRTGQKPLSIKQKKINQHGIK